MLLNIHRQRDKVFAGWGEKVRVGLAKSKPASSVSVSLDENKVEEDTEIVRCGRILF